MFKILGCFAFYYIFEIFSFTRIPFLYIIFNFSAAIAPYGILCTTYDSWKRNQQFAFLLHDDKYRIFEFFLFFFYHFLSTFSLFSFIIFLLSSHLIINLLYKKYPLNIKKISSYKCNSLLIRTFFKNSS